MSGIHFLADSGLVPVLIFATACAAGAWWWYRRLLGPVTGTTRMLPALRATAIFLVALMFAQPVFDYRRTFGSFAKVEVMIDASASMAVDDPALTADRRIAIAHALGLLSVDPRDPTLTGAAVALREAIAAGELATQNGQLDACLLAFDLAITRLKAIPEEQRQAIQAEPTSAATGSIAHEMWYGSSGPRPDQPDSLAKPDRSGTLPLFEAPRASRSDYTQRLRGLVYPPVSGNYTFWLASDDDSRLWLSSDATPERREVARVSNHTTARAWEQNPEQRSKPIQLEAGRGYWIEVLHRQGSGDDNLAVGWTLPDGTQERPLPGSRLSPPPSTPVSRDFASSLSRDLIDPVQQLRAADGDKQHLLNSLVVAAKTWEQAVSVRIITEAEQLLAQDSALQERCSGLAAMPRWERLEHLLLRGTHPLLQRLAEHHDVDLLTMREGTVSSLWSVRSGNIAAAGGLPVSLGDLPSTTSTDLSPIGALAADADRAGTHKQTTAILAFSDGRHNAGPAPEDAAAISGRRGIPIHTVGFGAIDDAPDLAIADITAPATVYAQDRLVGTVTLRDRMPRGLPFMLTVACEGTVLQETNLVSEGSGLRDVPLDASLEALVEQRLAKDPDHDWTSLPLALDVDVTILEHDREVGNNHRKLHLSAIVRRHRALIIDGRPRWEWRFLSAILDRDRRWEVDAVVPGDDGSLPRGPGALPTDQATLDSYQLIVLGDVSPALLGAELPVWIRDFVAKRGGGLLLIDGQRGQLASFANGPLGPLLPVAWDGVADSRRPSALMPTALGANLPPFRLAPDAVSNTALWANLRPPHWLATVRALPGSETLVEARLGDDPTPVPAAVLRRFGAGRTLLLASDEAWRMRFHVGDQFQEAYWNQLALWLMEEPFAVSDAYVSLDAGGPVLAAGNPAQIRVRLRDAAGRPKAGIGARALILAGDTVIAELPLAADDDGGVLRTVSAPLAPGTYAVRVSASGDPHADDALSAPLLVTALDPGELVDLRLDEQRLSSIAATSGGTYHREEDAGTLDTLLASLSDGRVEETRTVLWQTWWWFIPISILLGIEWALRRKAGIL